MSSDVRIAAVVNASAGGGRAAASWDALVRRLPELERARLVREPDAAGIRRGIENALAAGVERILVFGGDGSIHLVANIVLELGRGADVALGMVPLGTGSDLPRALGLPPDPYECASRVLASSPRPIDALELVTASGGRRFVVNVASAGISGLVDETVNSMPRRGASAYLRATLAALWRYQAVDCLVRLDGEVWYEGGILLLAAANGTSFGRGMQVAPLARLDDGEMDVVLIRPVPRSRLLFRLGRLYSGSHLDADFVCWKRARALEIEPRGGMPPFDLDGEVFPADRCSIRVRPSALRILA